MTNPAESSPLTFRRVLALRGPNVWANFPVLEVLVDLGSMKDTSSEMIPGFNDRLMSWLPSMIEHRCSIGERGGFFERLRRGTYLAHILEHVTLELQCLAGNIVGYGRARELDEDGVYRVAIEYQEETVGRAAVEVARLLCLAAVDNTPFDVDAEINKLKELVYDACLGPSTRSIVEGAKSRGVPFIRMNEGSLVQLGYGAKQRRILAAETDRTSAIAESIAQDKDLTRRLLQCVGVPVPEGRPVSSADDAWEAAQDIGLPVVVKPQCGNHGRGVTANLFTREEVQRAYATARLEEPTVMVEQYIEGSDFRLLVINGHLVAAARRDPAQVIGDGKSTIRELVDHVNRDPRRSEGHATVMSKIKIDEVALATMGQEGLTPESIPTQGQIVLIRRNANLSTGGTATDVTDQVHPEVAACAIDAAKAVGLDIAGIDVLAKDVSRPLSLQRGAIIEVNAGPGLRMHLEPSEGKRRAVGDAIAGMMFPEGENGRIPIVAVTGVNGKTTVTRLISHIMQLSGKCVGMTCTEGVYANGRRIETGDCSGPTSAKKILMNPRVEAAVLETARGGILRAGLAFDMCDVAVVTNIGEGDHLGLNNINTLEQLAKVKSTIVDVVAPTGSAVLNADDPLVAEMASKSPGGVVFFSRKADHPLLAERRAQGGRAVFVRDGSIILAHGESEFALLSLDRIPLTRGGRIMFHVENAMAAAAATWALGVPAEVVRGGLESFSPNLEGSPGRFNQFDYNGATLVVDYGHNISALKGVIEAMTTLPGERRLAVYSTAGDRRDEDMIRQGELLGEFFDQVYLYEGSYVRGRQKGDIIQCFKTGLDRGGRTKESQSFETWKIAVEHTLSITRAGDLVLIQADEVDESVAFFRDLLTRPTGAVVEPTPIDPKAAEAAHVPAKRKK